MKILDIIGIASLALVVMCFLGVLVLVYIGTRPDKDEPEL